LYSVTGCAASAAGTDNHVHRPHDQQGVVNGDNLASRAAAAKHRATATAATDN
jgi:hypothetical protein